MTATACPAGIPWLARLAKPAPAATPVALIPYDIPLRPGVRVRLILPEHLSVLDAERLCRTIHAIAMPDAS